VSSLNASILWPDLLRSLGCPARAAVLPTSAKCPVCQMGGIHVYHDLGGGWVRCQKCRFAGSIFELAATAWKLSPADTLRRLGGDGLLADMDQEARFQRHQARQGRYDLLRQVWRESQQADPWELLSLQLEHLCGDPVPLHNDWHQREGRWVTACEAKWLRQLVRGIAAGMPPSKWKSLLLVPLEEMPGRTAGFWCHSNTDEAVLLQSPFKTLRDRTRILGLGELAGSNYKTLVVSTDLKYVVRQQLASLQEIYRPAPLLGALIEARPNPIWRQLDKRLVFWAPTLTPALVREAASCNACMRIAADPAQGLSQVAKLSAISEKAVSWQEAVDRHLATLQPSRGADFLKETGLPPNEVRELLDHCRQSVRTSLLAVLTATPDTVQYGRYSVTVDGPRLFVNDKLVADAVIRILSLTDDKDPICTGEITFRKAVVKFRAKTSQLEFQPGAWLRHQLWKRSLGVPFVSAPWRAHLIPLAHLLGNPERVTKLPPTGWNEQAGGLVLSDYCLQRGGRVTWYKQKRQGGYTLGPPLPLSGRAIAAVSAVGNLSTFWAVLGNVAASLLAPLLGATAKPLVVCGHGDFSITLAAGRACGCPVYNLNEDVGELQQRLTQSRKNHWPLLLVAGDHRGFDDDCLAVKGGLAGAIIRPRNQFRGVVLAANTGCDLVVSGLPTSTAAAITEFGGDVLPAYLQDLAKRNYELPGGSSPLLQRVLDDVFHWWSELGGETGARHGIWSGPEVYQHALAEVLGEKRSAIRAIPRGFLDSACQSEYQANTQMLVETDHEHLYLPIQELQRLMVKRKLPLDLLKMQDGLLAAGLLQNVLPGDIWVLPYSLWLLASQKRKTVQAVAETG